MLAPILHSQRLPPPLHRAPLEAPPAAVSRPESPSVGGAPARPGTSGPGQGTEIAYSPSQLIAARRGQAVANRANGAAQVHAGEFRFAAGALPRDAAGRPNPDALVERAARAALSDAIDHAAHTGWAAGGAGFVEATDALFAEYAQDLDLSPIDLEAARENFIAETEGFFRAHEVKTGGEPLLVVQQPLRAVIADALNAHRERVMSRRQALLIGAGDLSRVLAELAVEARDQPELRPLRELGRFLGDLEQATAAHSTAPLRDGARERLLEPAAPPPLPLDPAATQRGERFLRWLDAA